MLARRLAARCHRRGGGPRRPGRRRGPCRQLMPLTADGRERMIREGRLPEEQEALAARLRIARALAESPPPA